MPIGRGSWLFPRTHLIGSNCVAAARRQLRLLLHVKLHLLALIFLTWAALTRGCTGVAVAFGQLRTHADRRLFDSTGREFDQAGCFYHGQP